MKKNILLCSLGFLFFIITGCVTQHQAIYYWGDYANTSTKYGMHGEEKKVFEKHLSELEKIINASETEKRRVAPGIYAEYAQLLYGKNEREKAKKYFMLEKQTYPESEIFIDSVLVKLYGEEIK